MNCDCGAYKVKDGFHSNWCSTVTKKHKNIIFQLEPNCFYLYNRIKDTVVLLQKESINPYDHNWLRVGVSGKYELIFNENTLDRITLLDKKD